MDFRRVHANHLACCKQHIHTKGVSSCLPCNSRCGPCFAWIRTSGGRALRLRKSAGTGPSSTPGASLPSLRPQLPCPLRAVPARRQLLLLRKHSLPFLFWPSLYSRRHRHRLTNALPPTTRAALRCPLLSSFQSRPPSRLHNRRGLVSRFAPSPSKTYVGSSLTPGGSGLEVRN